MIKLNVMLDDRRVGQLMERGGCHYFEYDVRFMAEGVELSPFNLPLLRGVTEHKNATFSTLPGLLYDSLPDRFGLSIIREHFSKEGRAQPRPIEILSYLGRRTMGALTYEPASGDTHQNQTIDLISAAQSARNTLEQSHEGILDPAILQGGATAGGAMPKILAAISPDAKRIVTGADHIPKGMEAWMIKLTSTHEPEQTFPLIEKAYFDMAEAAGIEVPRNRLLYDPEGRAHFAIKRFDRIASDPNTRRHIQTYCALTEIDMADANHDYDTLLRTTAALTQSQAAVNAQFRQMLFNVLAHNHDDHAKNFSFCMEPDGSWQLSPAYDLSFNENSLGGNWLLVGGKRSGISRAYFKTLARTHTISDTHFQQMLDEVKDAVLRWPEFAQRYDLSAGWTQKIQTAVSTMIKGL